jgi:hypothetical protein
VTFVPPLAIHLCWFATGATDPRTTRIVIELYELLHRPLADDGVTRPGLDIPTAVGRDLADLLERLAIGTEPRATVRVVVAILDQGAYANATARTTMTSAAARLDTTATEVLLPIVLHAPWHAELPPRAQRLAARTAALVDDPSRSRKLGSEVAMIVGRALRGRLGDPEPLRPQVFISYVMAECEELARRLAQHFNDTSPLRSETAHPVHGEELAQHLARDHDDSVVLVIRSDLYSENIACGLELLAAKRAAVPIVTLLAMRDGESLASAYGGNHRTITWATAREWDVTKRCVQAWLHDHYFRAYAREALARTGLPADTEVIARRPELLDLIALRAGDRLIVHPDPPLTEPEAQLLRDARPEIRVTTPRTMMGRVLLDRDPKPPLANTVIAFSLSTVHELPRVTDCAIGSGLTEEHLLDLLNSIVLATLYSGARIAFGGDFRSHGFTQRLAELHRTRRRLGTGAGAQLICFVDHGKRDGDADRTEFEPVEIALPAELDALPEAQRRWVWLSAMRAEMAKRSRARILLGGKSRPTATTDDDGYFGPWSGFLEEAWGTLEARGALYVVGGFSGVSALIARMLLTGTVPPDLQEATNAQTLEPRLAEVRAVRAAHGAAPEVARLLGTDGFRAAIAARWAAFVAGDANAWNNGLSVDENLQLFVSTDRMEITYLIFEGLRRLARSETAPREVSLYNGDIATANVDGYAVTVTPNVPPVGASIALDHRLNGQLSRTVLLEDDLVTVVNTAGSQLAGSSVFLARLRLPAAASELHAEDVAALATRVLQRADELGVQSIACTPFGATLGLDIAASARALQQGFEAAHVAGVNKIVICELDPARYEALATVFPNATRLRPAVQDARPVPSSAILQVSSSEVGGVRTLTAALMASQFRQAVVPRSDIAIPSLDWDAFQGRPMTFDETAQVGRALWTRLSATIQTQLGQLGAPLVVLTDDITSSLPWELLGDYTAAPLACSSGIVRRVLLPEASAHAGNRDRKSTWIRVLVVGNPTGDLPSASKEALEVGRAMGRRANFRVDMLSGGDASVSRVRAMLATGTYDVLHYAGHAFFDEKVPANSGLQLCDGVFRGDDLGDLIPPRLVVLSACESGKLRSDNGMSAAPAHASYSLTESFLRNGVAALVGTFFTVDSDAALCFATTAQEQVVAGQSIGAAVQTARRRLYDAKVTDWANFMLFGDDTLIL